ncbi:hypothetical protein NM208_g10599 [Fusarium decemcellulare]|uniref:Uncharacterized protein n=1 Tax=Fusarium decemcellulare TaxID=57161 RepID=A0ACC1RX99_9HYPO|nr:hypothetical protein NM208_g10599 [Fusarium decemcellulare]
MAGAARNPELLHDYEELFGAAAGIQTLDWIAKLQPFPAQEPAMERHKVETRLGINDDNNAPPITLKSNIGQAYVGVSALDYMPAFMVAGEAKDNTKFKEDNTTSVKLKTEPSTRICGKSVIWSQALLVRGNMAFVKQGLWGKLPPDDQIHFISIAMREHQRVVDGLGTVGVANTYPCYQQDIERPRFRSFHPEAQYETLHFRLMWPPMAVLAFGPKMIDAVKEFLKGRPEDNIPLNLTLAAISSSSTSKEMHNRASELPSSPKPVTTTLGSSADLSHSVVKNLSPTLGQSYNNIRTVIQGMVQDCRRLAAIRRKVLYTANGRMSFHTTQQQFEYLKEQWIFGKLRPGSTPTPSVHYYWRGVAEDFMRWEIPKRQMINTIEEIEQWTDVRLIRRSGCPYFAHPDSMPIDWNQKNCLRLMTDRMRTGWPRTPKTLRQRINGDRDNNILIETRSSNFLKHDYSEAFYPVLKDLVLGIPDPIEWANAEVIPSPYEDLEVFDFVELTNYGFDGDGGEEEMGDNVMEILEDGMRNDLGSLYEETRGFRI